MTAHTKLKLHLERYAYKRGRNIGDAPADQYRRGKTHFRVIKGNGGQMIVRMHNADLITAYEDGRIKLDTRGWHTSPTTRQCMSYALRTFTGNHSYISAVRYGNYSQTGLCIHGKKYRYYDGMEFAADGTLLSKALAFTAKRIDREETAEFRADIKESGFVDMFPVLYNAAEIPTQGWLPVITRKIMTSDAHSNHWPDLVALVKYPNYFCRSTGLPAYDSHKQALRALVASVTKNMTKFVDTDVTVL